MVTGFHPRSYCRAHYSPSFSLVAYTVLDWSLYPKGYRFETCRGYRMWGRVLVFDAGILFGSGRRIILKVKKTGSRFKCCLFLREPQLTQDMGQMN